MALATKENETNMVPTLECIPAKMLDQDIDLLGPHTVTCKR